MSTGPTKGPEKLTLAQQVQVIALCLERRMILRKHAVRELNEIAERVHAAEEEAGMLQKKLRVLSTEGSIVGVTIRDPETGWQFDLQATHRAAHEDHTANTP